MIARATTVIMKTSRTDSLIDNIKRDQEEITRLTKKIEKLNLQIKDSIEELHKVDDSDSLDTTKIYLTKKPSGRIKEGDLVRVINHYRGRYGDLFGKIGTVKSVGKTFIFFDVKGIPTTQQRTEENLELIVSSEKKKKVWFNRAP